MSLRRRLALTLLFSAVFIAALLALAPSTLMGHVVERASGGQLMLARTQGSLWQGSGILLFQNSSGIRSLGVYHWHLQPWRAAMQLQAGTYEPMSLQYRPLLARLDIEHLRLDLPAALLEVAAPQLHPYRLQGALQAHAGHLQLDARGLLGQITVDWLNAASGLSPIAPLGDYRIVLQGDGQKLAANLSTQGGKLQMQARGQLDPSKGVQISGTAQAAAGAEDELNELLHYIGPETRPGIYTLALMPQSVALP
ncbi:MAG: type II secretion system protein N [Gammaproteobacteria bacterium]|nr:type II secretion system protein N [Gammaproteobacteria bacterium]